jgi:hypothetical protein
VRSLEHLWVGLVGYLAGLCTACAARRLRRRSTRHWTCVLPPGHDGPCQPWSAGRE